MHFSISELLVVLLVTLLVVKPDRFPELMQEGASFMKWMKDWVQKIKQDLFHESSNERKF